MTVSVPAGWVYLEVVDPGGGVYPIASVRRSDGANLLVGPNVWQTPARIHMVPAKPDNLIHIFDYNSTGSYTVTYGLPITPPDATTLNAVNITATNATLNALVNPDGATTQVHFQWGTTTNYGNVTATTTLSDGLNSAQAVALAVGGRAAEHDESLPRGRRQQRRDHFGRGRDFRHAAAAAAGHYAGRQPVHRGRARRGHHQSRPGRHHAGHLQPRQLGPGRRHASATNGVFQWNPSCEQGSSTNLITIWATDSSTPPLSNSMSFLVVVSECVQVGIGSTVMQDGPNQQRGCHLVVLGGPHQPELDPGLPVQPLRQLRVYVYQCRDRDLRSPGAGLGAHVLQSGDQAGPDAAKPLRVGLDCVDGAAGALGFPAVGSCGHIGTKDDGTFVGNIVGQPGIAVVIGAEPLLTAWRDTNATRMLTIYGNPGTNYQLTYSTNLLVPNWQPAFTVPMTNLFESVPVDQAAPQIFYRAH